MAERYSYNRPINYEWFIWKTKTSLPKYVRGLPRLEEEFAVFGLYLWLGQESFKVYEVCPYYDPGFTFDLSIASYRLPDMFPDMELIRKHQFKFDYASQRCKDTATTLFKDHTAQVKPAATENYDNIAKENNDIPVKPPIIQTPKVEHGIDEEELIATVLKN